MSQIQDYLAALIAYLKADAAVAAQVGTRVYGEQVPPASVTSWTNAGKAQKAVVLTLAGGLSAGLGVDDYVEITTPRVDVWNYGGSPYEAREVYRATHGALFALNRNRQGTTLIHWCKPGGGPQSLRLPDNEWDVVIEPWLVMAAQVAVS